MSSLTAVAKGYFNTYFWNQTHHHGHALLNKALEICTQQKVGNSFWNIGIVALTGAAVGTVTLLVNGIFHKILLGIYRQIYSEGEIIKGQSDEQVEHYIFDKSTLFPIFSIMIRNFAFMAGAAGGYQVASRLTPKLEVFSGDDVIKFTLYPLFTSTVFFFMPVTSWGGIVVGMASALPFGAWNGALKIHSLYMTSFSAALFTSGVTSTIYRLCAKI